MKQISVIIIVLLSIFCIGCKRYCPSFDEDILNWIPYQEDDEIVLRSQSNDLAIIFSIKSIEITHQTHYTIGYKCGTCDDRIEIIQNDHDTFYFYAMLSLHKNKITSLFYKIGDTFFDAYSEKEFFLFEGKEYNKVRIFEQTDSKGTFKKLIIAKEFGIIGLIDIYGNTWTLTTKKLKERKNIVINNVSC